MCAYTDWSFLQMKSRNSSARKHRELTIYRKNCNTLDRHVNLAYKSIHHFKTQYNVKTKTNSSCQFYQLSYLQRIMPLFTTVKAMCTSWPYNASISINILNFQYFVNDLIWCPWLQTNMWYVDLSPSSIQPVNPYIKVAWLLHSHFNKCHLFMYFPLTSIIQFLSITLSALTTTTCLWWKRLL